jgi:hypothetical protein
MKKLSNEKVHSISLVSETSVLDEILSQEMKDRSAEMSAENNLPFCGLVLDDTDPKNQQRALVQWQMNGTLHEARLHRTAGVALKQGDTVLIQSIKNRPDPVVIGVLERSAIDRETTQVGVVESKTSLVLSAGASIQIATEDGRPLLEVSITESGPKLRLLGPDAVIDIPGDLSFNAKSIKLHATAGKVEVGASDDVVVVGKNIYLN